MPEHRRSFQRTRNDKRRLICVLLAMRVPTFRYRGKAARRPEAGPGSTASDRQDLRRAEVADAAIRAARETAPWTRARRSPSSTNTSRCSPCISARYADLQRTASPMDRQIREVRRDTVSRAPGALRHEDKSSAREEVQPAVD